MIPRFGQAISKIEGVMQNRQNQFKMHYSYIPTFLKVILGGPVRPSILRVEIFFLVKPVQNLYLGKVN